MFSASELSAWVRDARRMTLELIADLDEEQLLGPRLDVVNPLRWEVGHVAWFQEKWALRHAAGEKPIRADADTLYDSAAIAHDTRWDLLLPSRRDTIAYMTAVHDRILDRLAEREPTPQEAYFIALSVFHEDMHTEAFIYTRQTLGWSAPTLTGAVSEPPPVAGAWPGDARVPGGAFALGARMDEPFVFDNEKWAHPVEVTPFLIAKAPVTQSEYAAFVDERGYARPEFWSPIGWQWRTRVGANAPVYWRRRSTQWERRDFDRWVALEPHRPMLHVSWHEAEAYCRWARRRLPTEVEWEAAAAGVPEGRHLAAHKRRYPWGDTLPTPAPGQLEGRSLGCADVAAHAAGDSACGCRQMIGNVWEWTANDFLPYPGFVADPYKEYSEPWFGTHKVLRGGAWPTRGRLLRNTWRNFYRPERRDIWAGFRTCAL
jgi:iron(II)-dependent oxidoreductase